MPPPSAGPSTLHQQILDEIADLRESDILHMYRRTDIRLDPGVPELVLMLSQHGHLSIVPMTISGGGEPDVFNGVLVRVFNISTLSPELILDTIETCSGLLERTAQELRVYRNRQNNKVGDLSLAGYEALEQIKASLNQEVANQIKQGYSTAALADFEIELTLNSLPRPLGADGRRKAARLLGHRTYFGEMRPPGTPHGLYTLKSFFPAVRQLF